MSIRKGPAFIFLLVCLALSFTAPAEAEFKLGVEGRSATKLHLPVNLPFLFDTSRKIYSVSVSKPEIAEVTVVNPRRLKITGKVSGSATLVYWIEGNIPISVDLEVWAETVEGAKTGAVEQATSPAQAAETGRDRQPFLVAVLPVENQSGTPGPLVEIRQMLTEGLKSRGIAVLPERDLAGFMARHRMRHTGGINKEMAQAFLRETGARAVLVTSLEHSSDGPPPKISFVARLVSTGDNVVILGMQSIGMSGDDHPGILGIGLIENPEKIRRKAVGSVLDFLARSIPGGMPKVAVRSACDWKYRPKRFFRSPDLDLGKNRPVTVAVVPFLNIGTRKNAGSLMELHFVDRLARVENVQVVEPGVVREELLRLRIIMQGGLSGPQADLLFSMLDADLLLTGVVAEYQEGTGGGVKVGFSVLAFDMKSRRVVWSSRSYNRGDDGVFFFELGDVKTVAAMVSEMARAVIDHMVIGEGIPEGETPGEGCG